jgi:hypothetical protein
MSDICSYTTYLEFNKLSGQFCYVVIGSICSLLYEKPKSKLSSLYAAHRTRELKVITGLKQIVRYSLSTTCIWFFSFLAAVKLQWKINCLFMKVFVLFISLAVQICVTSERKSSELSKITRYASGKCESKTWTVFNSSTAKHIFELHGSVGKHYISLVFWM